MCAAPGTRLSTIAEGLTQNNRDVQTCDLERLICETYWPALAESQESPKLQNTTGTTESESQEEQHLGTLLRTRPQHELRNRWKEAWIQCLAKIEDARDDDVFVITHHMTWYTADTSEFFIPVDYDALYKLKNRVTHVVVLMDDAYEMYSRLRKESLMFSDHFVNHRHKRLSDYWGLDLPIEDENTLDFRGDEANLLYVRQWTTVAALSHMINWRRAEIMQAESIARMLGTKFSVFGIKHTEDALLKLISAAEPARVYLSHRISEIRREYLDIAASGSEQDDWPPVATEISSLHRHFAGRNVILITPTAIDEMRFENASGLGTGLAKLSNRWPLPSESAELLWEEAPGGVEQEDILVQESPALNDHKFNAQSWLSQQVFHDVGFRDHVIVEHTPNLCVWRPFYSRTTHGPNAEWSSGVRAEVRHWQRRHDLEGSQARIGFVHTRTEMQNRMMFLKQDRATKADFDNGLVRLFQQKRRENILALQDAISQFLQAGASSLQSEAPDVTPARAQELLDLIRDVANTVLISVFTSDEALKEGTWIQAPCLTLSVEESSGETKDVEGTVELLGQFFRAKMAPQKLYQHNQHFLSTLDSIFEQVFGKKLVPHVCERLNLRFETIQTRASGR